MNKQKNIEKSINAETVATAERVVPFGHNKKVIELLWTGGWDSTFRMVELSRQFVTIQPIYIISKDRNSKKKELTATEKIRQALITDSRTNAKILDIKLINKNDIPENMEITTAWERIHQLTKLGTQYEWIARYALLNPGLEIGVEKGDPDVSYANCALRKYGKLIEIDKDSSKFKVDPENSNSDVVKVLGNLTFPIIEKTELEMKKLIKEWGYEDIMKMIWFCHTPIHNQPCGLCRPCNEKIESNMEWLLPEEALKRNANVSKHTILNIPYKIYRKLMSKIN